MVACSLSGVLISLFSIDFEVSRINNFQFIDGLNVTFELKLLPEKMVPNKKKLFTTIRFFASFRI